MPRVSKSNTKKPQTQKPKKVQVKKNLSEKDQISVYNISGKVIGKVTLPKNIFGQKPNMTLIAQAMRVYESRLHPHTAHTKTRSQVRGGGAKPWRQKGTGRARAGSSRSPLWVGGGTTFGPLNGKRELTLPKKMRQKALISSLSIKSASGEIKVVSGLDKIDAKTKLIQNLFSKLETTTPIVLVADSPKINLKLALRNIQNTFLEEPKNLNAYKILKAKNLIFAKEALEKIT